VKGATDEEEHAMAKARGSAKGKGKVKRPARKAAPRKAATGTLTVKTKVPKKEAKALIDLFLGGSVYVEPEPDPTTGALAALRVLPTRIGDD
jgi:hypothetical protein